MLLYTVNIWGVVLSAIAAMIIGMLWYSRVLFGKKWSKLVGMTPDMEAAARKRGNKSYPVMFVAALVTAYILGLFINNMFVPTLNSALLVAFFAWLGFVATSMSGEYLFNAKLKPWMLYAINAGYQLVTLLVSAVILYLFLA